MVRLALQVLSPTYLDVIACFAVGAAPQLSKKIRLLHNYAEITFF